MIQRYSNADRGGDGTPILDDFGDKVPYAGSIIQAIAEGLALGVKAGVEVRGPAVDPGKAATFVSTHPEGDR